LLAALLMLLPSGASARTLYYCQMMGRAVASCCCETKTAAQAPRTAQQFRIADCCQRISPADRGASLRTLEAAGSVAPAALLATVPASFSLVPQRDVASLCAESTQAPLAIGPPLFVAHCAFLS